MNQQRTADIEAGKQMHEFASELFPICRSITGDGTRATLRRVAEEIDLEIHEVPTGTRVLDWIVPQEWNIRDAYIKNPAGERVVDFRRSNLHVMSYSVPVRGRMSLEELRPHLFSDPEHPDWIPYRTSYYSRNWGFCLSHNELVNLPDTEYEVCIDSSLQDGRLTYAELSLPGRLSDEVLISCHICHPSMANDNLSGLAVAVWLARELRDRPRHYSYRFVFLPATIGPITWLARNEDRTGRIKNGLVLTCVGDSADLRYKKSRHGDAEIDRAFAHVLAHSGNPYEVMNFSPYGYDERQYCSPGFDLPVGCLMRSMYGRFPEYHSSADNLGFVKAEYLAGSLRACLAVVEVLEHNRRYLNLSPKGEPQLGRRGLYRHTGGPDVEAEHLALLWVLNLSDGHHSLLDIAERAELSFPVIHQAAVTLERNGLLREQDAA